MYYSYLKSKRFLLPTLLWLIFVLIYIVLFSVGDSKYYTLTRTLTQWDGQHYLSIARDGYEIFPCPYNRNYICGNIGWFPLYPLAGRVIAQLTKVTGLDIQAAMLITSWLAFWLALLVMYRLIEDRLGRKAALVSLTAMLLFPSSFYFLTGFPYSIFLLLAVLVFYLLEKERYSAIALPAGFLAVTYPSGIVISLPILYILVSKWTRLDLRKKISLLGALLAIGLALFLYACYYWWKFDDFFLYQRFQAQSYYAHQVTLPLLPIIRSFLNLKWNDPVFVILLFTIILVVLLYSRKIPASWQLFMFGILLFTPSLGTTTCYYRHIVIAFPFFAMIGVSVNSRYRKFLLIPYAIVALVLSWKVFLSAYKAGMLM